MKKESSEEKQISRRGILATLGLGLLFPIFGFGSSKSKANPKRDKKPEQEYQTLLKADGTIVKVKTSTVEKSQVIRKNLSNKSFFNWLNNSQ